MKILMKKFEGESAPANFPQSDIAFVGDHVDKRGIAALSFAKSHSDELHTLNYDPLTLEICLDGVQLVADYLPEHLVNTEHATSILIEATTLGLPEIYLLLRALKLRTKATIQILYLEPKQYNGEKGNFELSEAILGFLPIPGAIIDLNSRRLKRGLFFLGYEGERLERIFEDQKMIRSDDVTIVFGVPAYQAGWEMQAILHNLDTIKDRSLGHDVRYCAADNPAASYEIIENVFDALDVEEQMFIAPIGTKPAGIGAALFAVNHEEKVGLLYDHPRRKKSRTAEINAWHLFEINL